MYNVSYEILPNGNLRIFCDKETQKGLATLRADNPDVFESDAMMADVLETVVANGLCWTSSDYTGDLTSAPMLCETISDHGWPEGKYWAYMQYCIHSPQRDLLETGESIWEAGDELPPIDRIHALGEDEQHTLCGLEIKEYRIPLGDKITPRCSRKIAELDCFKCEAIVYV